MSSSSRAFFLREVSWPRSSHTLNQWHVLCTYDIKRRKRISYGDSVQKVRRTYDRKKYQENKIFQLSSIILKEHYSIEFIVPWENWRFKEALSMAWLLTVLYMIISIILTEVACMTPAALKKNEDKTFPKKPAPRVSVQRTTVSPRPV